MKKKQKPEPIGTMHPKPALMLLELVGNASLEGSEYRIYTSVNRSPVIESKATGKKFHLPWADFVKIAIQQGIDKEE